jgi:pimeloyl-ACP methyl ester carboxylesterase
VIVTAKREDKLLEQGDTGSVVHPSGRVISYALFGAAKPKGVVFYSHGFPASGAEAVIADAEATRLGITIVALDRPGFGGSSYYPNRRFEDWGEDVKAVADHLGVSQFAILGVSGGTPAAIAAAGVLEERVSSLVIVSGVSPVRGWRSLKGMNWANRGLLLLARKAPALARGLVWCIAQGWRIFPRLIMVWFATLLPGVDRRVLARREVVVAMAKSIRGALSQGVRGAVLEFMLLASDWSPLCDRARVPTTIWHGDADSYVPLGMGLALRDRLVGSEFREVAGGGHLMIVDIIPEVLESISF